MKKYTIKDIAKLADVSKGTVDRVIHKRGKVSKKALEKVTKIIREIDYKPNLLARSLKNTKDYHICVVLPDYNKDPFWEACREGINEAIEEFKSFGIFIESYFFDLADSSSFLAVNKQVLALTPDAVLLTPLFYKETVDVVNKYNAANILVSKFNNQLDINNTQNFVGQDLYKSGRIAASLMQTLTAKDSTILSIHIDEDINNATHIQQKEKGFKSYFEEIGNYNLLSFSCKDPDIVNSLTAHLKTITNLSGVFVSTSKAYKITEIFKGKNIKIIGYDLVQKNITLLKKKEIDFLINQNPKKQVYLGLSLLVDYFLFDKEIPKQSLLPIDIINAENVDTYL
jgi:LacI family transcriptional regulator